MADDKTSVCSVGSSPRQRRCRRRRPSAKNKQPIQVASQPAQSYESESSCPPPWADLVPEALAEIFRRLPFEDRLGVVPQVCKSWNKASYIPACWRVVDMVPWLDAKAEEDVYYLLTVQRKADHLVKVVVNRSGGQLLDLRTADVSEATAAYVTERCPQLTFEPISIKSLALTRIFSCIYRPFATTPLLTGNRWYRRDLLS